jgi:hypothetical protein
MCGMDRMRRSDAPTAGGRTLVNKGLVQGKFARLLYSAQPVPNCRKLSVKEGVIDPHTFDVVVVSHAQLEQSDVS